MLGVRSEPSSQRKMQRPFAARRFPLAFAFRNSSPLFAFAFFLDTSRREKLVVSHCKQRKAPFVSRHTKCALPRLRFRPSPAGVSRSTARFAASRFNSASYQSSCVPRRPVIFGFSVNAASESLAAPGFRQGTASAVPLKHPVAPRLQPL